MRPTDEQQAVIDAVHQGGNVVVQAAAGAGKTSTLRHACAGLTGPTLYLVYNKKAKEDARKSFPKTVECRTIHSVAYRSMARALGGHGELNDRLWGERSRIPSWVAAKNLNVTHTLLIDDVKLTPSMIMRIACTTVERFCQSADTDIDEHHIPHQRGIPGLGDIARLKSERDQHRAGGNHQLATEAHNLWETALYTRKAFTDVVLPLARKVWDRLCVPGGRSVRFVPDHYLKMWQLTAPVLGYATVMLDEAQDSNPVTASIVTSQHCQRVAIGDGFQQLYGWRGAVDALNSWPADQCLFLTQSWRFGQTIADEANKWLRLMGTPLRVRGNPTLTSIVTTGVGRTPDAVLCRTNGGVIAQLLGYLEANVPVAVEGGVKALQSFVRAANTLIQTGRCNHPDLDLFESWEQVQDYADTDEGADLKVFTSLVDRYGCTTLARALDGTTRSDRARVTLSTAHKAKGAEWDTVRIHDDYQAPELKDGKRPRPSRADSMLGYVAVTRARRNLDRTGLAWIDDIPASGPAAGEHIPASTPVPPDEPYEQLTLL